MVDLDARPPTTPFSERIAFLNMRAMEAINVALFRLSKGRTGGTIFGQPVILLTVSGRRTGESHTKPVLALPDGEAWIVAASRGGTRRNPDWFENLRAYEERRAAGTLDAEPVLAAPEVEVRGGYRFEVAAEVLAGDERRQWWARLVEVYPRFKSYQERVPQRTIPVVRLVPVTH